MQDFSIRFELGGMEIGLLSGGFLLLFICVFAGAFALGRILRARDIRWARNDAVGRSRSVLLGEVYEQLTPLLPDFPFSPRDMVFVGKGVDYIVFDGLSEGMLRQIVFLECKTGGAKQNTNEKMIESVIKQAKVSYRMLRLERK